jgi:pimeloyl-ACP methyl ester carboxylesterase
MAKSLMVSEGVLPGGLPYFAFGAGRPLLVLRGFMTVHRNPTGLQRRFEVRLLAPLAEQFRVFAVGRAPGLQPGASMADIARQHAEAVRTEFGSAVDVVGISSGGSVALQLAADHPDVVRRRRGGQFLVPFKVQSRVGARLLAPVAWLLDPLVRPTDPADMVAFARAEDAFDLGSRLGEIAAPTLVIAGARDSVYSPEIFTRTAQGVANGRLVVYPRTGHGGTLTHRRFASDVISFLQV